MAKLRDLIGCILNEFTLAQHQANSRAASLGREYAENDLLRYFMIPNAYADNLAFNLKFAVKPEGETETVSEVNYQKLMQFFSQLAVSVVETAITTMLFASEESIIGMSGNYMKLKEKEKVLRTDFHDYLSAALREELVQKAVNEVDAEGYPDHGRIFELAMEVIRRKFFEHPELKLAETGTETFNRIKETCSSFVSTLIEHSCKRINVLETRSEAVPDIIVDATGLAEISPEHIQQVAFSVNLRNYQVSKMDTEHGSRDCIIPAHV